MDEQTVRSIILAASLLQAIRCFSICAYTWLKIRDPIFMGWSLHYAGWAVGATYFGIAYFFGLPGNWMVEHLIIPNLSSLIMVVGSEIIIRQAKAVRIKRRIGP